MSGLYQSHLDFFQEAKEAFEKNHLYETYTNKDESLIALRYGMDRDCIKVYRLDGEVAFLHNIMGRCPLEIKIKDVSL